MKDRSRLASCDSCTSVVCNTVGEGGGGGGGREIASYPGLLPRGLGMRLGENRAPNGGNTSPIPSLHRHFLHVGKKLVSDMQTKVAVETGNEARKYKRTCFENIRTCLLRILHV